jgi:hypothetical protein
VVTECRLNRFSQLFKETSRLKVAWDALNCAISPTTGLILPIEILHGVALNSRLAVWWTAFSLLGLLDVWVGFNIFLEKNSIVITDRRLISRHYLHGMFWTDLIANLPFFLASGLSAQNSAIGLLPLIRLPRLLHITGRWEDLQLLPSSTLRIIRYGMTLALITNGITCLWLWVGLSDTGADGWIQRLDLDRSDFGSLYLHSLYWTVTTLATVGYGDITPKNTIEIIIAVMMMILGAILLAFAIAIVVSILGQFDAGKVEHRNRQTAITRYLISKGVDADAVRRIRH